MACWRCGSCCSQGSASPKQVFPNRPQKLGEIEGSLDHKLTLDDWKAQLAASSSNMVRKLDSRNSSRSDLYQILGLFFVFEGVVITAVAQFSSLTCKNSWLIFALSVLVSVATLFACIQKLKEIAEADQIYLEEKALCSALFACIEELKEQGTSFDLVKRQPTLRHRYTGWEDQSSGCPPLRVGIRSLWKKWVWSYAGAVFFFLLAFSAVTLVAVRVIVCDALAHSN